MTRAKYRIVDPSGLHARPAARFVKAINAAGLSGTVIKGARAADMKSILEILGLGIDSGDIIELNFNCGGEDIPTELAAILERIDPAQD